MNKLLPIHFDSNEWFLTISFCVAALIAIMLPRRFPTIITVTLLCLGFGVASFFDFYLGVPPLDLYDVNDTPDYELFELLVYALTSPFTYIYIYLFDLWKIRGIWISLYVLGWSALGVAFEGLAAFMHVFHYKGWTLGYSFVFYLASQPLILLLYYRLKAKYAEAASF